MLHHARPRKELFSPYHSKKVSNFARPKRGIFRTCSRYHSNIDKILWFFCIYWVQNLIYFDPFLDTFHKLLLKIWFIFITFYDFFAYYWDRNLILPDPFLVCYKILPIIWFTMVFYDFIANFCFKTWFIWIILLNSIISGTSVYF